VTQTTAARRSSPARAVRGLGDFNLDGHQDLVLSGDGGVQYAFIGHGDGTFEFTWTFGERRVIGLSEYVKIVDIVGDEFDDIVVVDSDPKNPGVWVFAGMGDGTFDPQRVIHAESLENGIPGFEVLTNDFNEDGRLDIVLMWKITEGEYEPGNRDEVRLFLGQPDGTFDPEPIVVDLNFAEIGEMHALDLNIDGNIDIVFKDNRRPHTLNALYGYGDGFFSQPQTILRREFQEVVFEDVNFDGFPDLIVSGGGYAGPGLEVILQQTPFELASRFVRGDVDSDGLLNVTDVVVSLGHQFLGDPLILECKKSADVNDDGTVDITDATSLLGYLFLGGPAPNEPFSQCGTDATVDSLTCKSYNRCP
jgi:hypothetical protein